MRFKRGAVFERYVAEFAEVGGVFFGVGFLLDVYCGDGGCLVLCLWFLGRVDEARVPHHVPSIRGSVCAGAAAVDPLAYGWCWGCRLATLFLDYA